jgi:predicted dehydrogenase
MAINVAILGFGNSAQTFHLPFLKSLPEQYKLHSILERKATPTSSKARDWLGARQWPNREGVKIVNTFEEVEGDADVQLVIVTTGNDTHFEFAKVGTALGPWSDA